MSRAFVLLLLLLAVAPAATARAADPVALLAAGRPDVVDLGQGATAYEWRLDDRAGTGRPLQVVAVVVPDGAAHWRVVAVDRTAQRAVTLAALDCGTAPVVASGGFFAAAEGGGFEPLGLAVADGAVLSPFSPRRFGGVLVRDGAGSAIVPIARFDPEEAHEQALQSSPIIVAGGANDMLRDDGRSANRLAIGLDGDGGLVVIGAFRSGGGAVSLFTFAELILALDAAAGIAVVDALAMDGGPSAQILLPANGRHWGSGLPGYMPNALCLGTEAPG